MNEKLEENDVVLCTVRRIEKTTVFLDVHLNNTSIQGTMIFSEVSPGRIRNIREYVVPNKKIVCKVLRLKEGHPELSLRRVTGKEREEIQERYKKEKILTNILKPVLKEKTPSILNKIKSDFDPSDFLDDIREDPKILSKYVPENTLEALKKIITEKKESEKSVTKEIKITSQSSSGLSEIKEILNIQDKTIDIYYLGSSKFAITAKSKNYKEANHILDESLEEIKAKSKKLHAKIEIKEK